MPTTLKSVRLPTELLNQIALVQGTASFNQIVRTSLKQWLKRRKRKNEDALITRSLTSRSPKQIAEEEQLVRGSSDAAVRVLKEAD